MKKEDIELILEEGEGYLIEFKEKLSNIDKEMVAFANGSGGKILMGISDTGKIIGINVTNKLKSQIQDIANNCDPAINIVLEKIENILIVHVKSGQDKPYHCSSGFYIRVGPNAQKMNRNQIIEFFQAEGKIRFDELSNLKFEYDTHFSESKFDHFLSLSNISKIHDTATIMRNLGVAEKQEGRVIFNNTGILMFAKNLQDIYFHTAVTCALYKGSIKATILDRKEFNSDIVSNVDKTMLFLKQHIPVRYEFDGSPQRIEVPQIPYEALREAVINAIIHRDYFEKGANVMVEIFDDRIEISSPGGLVRGLESKDFGKKSVLRNPNIANLFQRIGYIEKMGTGIVRMQLLIKEAGLKPIGFSFTKFVTAKFFRQKNKERVIYKVTDRVTSKVTDEVTDRVTDNQKTIIELISKNIHITITELSELVGISTRKIKENIAKLKEKNVLKRIGTGKTGYWELIIEQEDADQSTVNAVSEKKVTYKVTKRVTDKVTDNQKAILELISKNPHITTTELSKFVGISTRKIKENTAKLKGKRILKRVGNNKTGYWEIISI